MVFESVFKPYIVSLVSAASYVGILYLPFNVSTPQFPRTHPRTIKRRLISAVVLSIIWLTITAYYLTYYARTSTSLLHALASFGIIPGLKHKSIKTTWSVDHLLQYLKDFGNMGLLFLILFIGPVLDSYFTTGDIVGDFFEEISTIEGKRNIIIGPITEELVYRTTLLSILLTSKKTPIDVLIFLTPLYFGVAHIHHAWELRNNQNLPWNQIILVCGAQFIYTSLFGSIESFLWLRTGNTWGICWVHAFCNYFGFPSWTPSENRRTPKGWKWIYRILLLIGAVSFKELLFKMTKSHNSPISWYNF